MISERKMASAFTSFWKEATPLADAFVRRVNIQRQRYSQPYFTKSDPKKRGLINELAFRLFGQWLNDGKVTRSDFTVAQLNRVTNETIEYIARLPALPESQSLNLSKSDTKEALDLANRMARYFATSEKKSHIVLRPSFPGCGLLHLCAGDLLVGTTLYEVKAGERDFRVVDLRQLIVYCALNYAAAGHNIENVGLLNPRMGVFYESDIETMVRGIAGTTASELFSEIVDFLSSATAST